jgi:hypothetical protein
MSLSKTDILKVEDLPREKMSVPEWGGHIWIRVLTGAEADSLGSTAPSPARIAMLSVCDKDGVRLFGEKDMSTLQAKSSVVLRRIVEAALKLSGLSTEAGETLRGN